MSEDVMPAPVPAGEPAPALPPPARAPWWREARAAFAIDAVLATTLVFLLGSLLGVLVILPSLLAAGGKPLGDMDAFMKPLMPQIVTAAIFGMLIAALAMWALRGRGLAALPRRLSTSAAYGLAVAAGIGVQLFALLMSLLLGLLDTGLHPSNAEPLIALEKSTPWLAWLMVVLVGPFAEELLFRHVLLRRLALAGRALAGLLVVSLLFSLMHEPVPGDQPLLAWLGALVLYTGMGVGFGAVYLRTGRFGAAFVAHAVCNFAAMVALAYSTG